MAGIKPAMTNSDSVQARNALAKLFGVEPEHFALAVLGVEPQKSLLRIGALDRGAAASDLAKQTPTLVEMLACFSQNPPNNRKSVASAFESHLRLRSSFTRSPHADS